MPLGRRRSRADFAGPPGRPSELRLDAARQAAQAGAGLSWPRCRAATGQPAVKWLSEHGEGRRVIGAKTRESDLYRPDAQAAECLHIATDETLRRLSRHVQALMKELVEIRGEALRRVRGHRPDDNDEVRHETARSYRCPTTVSLNALMVDGRHVRRMPRERATHALTCVDDPSSTVTRWTRRGHAPSGDVSDPRAQTHWKT